MPNPPVGLPATDLKRAIGFWAGAAIVIGSIVGSGIFRTPAEIVRVLPNPGVVLALWVIFGLAVSRRPHSRRAVLAHSQNRRDLRHPAESLWRRGGVHVRLDVSRGSHPCVPGRGRDGLRRAARRALGGAAFDLVSFSRERDRGRNHRRAHGNQRSRSGARDDGAEPVHRRQDGGPRGAVLPSSRRRRGGLDSSIDRRRRSDGRARSGGGFHHLHLQRLGLPRSGGGRGQGPRRADQAASF